MTTYTNNVEFTFDQSLRLEEKLNHYLGSYNFKQVKNDQNSFSFARKGSLLDGWNFNPLAWKSKINISLKNTNTISIKGEFFGNGTITPVAFVESYDGFINNLEQYITQDREFEQSNAEQIKRAKKKQWGYYAILFLGMICIILLANYVRKLTGNSVIGMALIVLGTILSMKLLNLVLNERSRT